MTAHTTRRTAALSIALLGVALAAAACAPSPPSNPPDITGVVTSVVAGDGRPASFQVEGAKPQPSGAAADKAMVNVPTSTQFFGPNGTQATLAQIGAIGPGTKVRVWFEGAIAESYPVQGSAKAVQILSP